MRIKRGLKEGLAETRKIKIGGKGAEKTSKNGNKFQMPQRWDHFKVCKTAKDASNNFVVDAEIHKLIGDNKPKELRIYLPYDSVDMNFPTCYQYYKGKKRLCVGDGEVAAWQENGKKGECNPDTCKHFQNGDCKISGRLHCILADAPSMGCVAVFRTHSFHSVSDILNSLQIISDYTGGVLRGLPLTLELLERETAEYGTVRTVSVSFAAGDFKRLREAAIEERKERELLCIDVAQIEQRDKKAGAVDDTDDPEDVAAEYYAQNDTEAITLAAIGDDDE